MKSYLLLLKLGLRNMLNSFRGASIRKENGKLDLPRIALCIVASASILLMAGMVIWLEVTLYEACASVGLENLVIGIAVLLSMIMTLLFGVFHTLGAMYFNKDTAAMAYLPISSRVHMAAKWTEIYLSEAAFSLVILLPLLICHGVAKGMGILYYGGIVALVLTSPLYPLAISLLMASLLGRITSLTRNKETWVVLGTIVLLVVVLGSEWMLLPKIPEDADALFFLRLMMDNEALLQLIIGAFPPVMWAVQGISGSFLHALLFVGSGLAAIGAVLWMAGGSYIRVCLLHTEQGIRKRRVGRGSVSSDARSPFVAVFWREMNEVLKTPVYLLNAVMSVLMMPIVMFATATGYASGGEVGEALLPAIHKLIASIAPTDLVLILTVMFTLMSLMCPLSATAISREGKRLPVMRMIPVAPRTILWAKLLVNIVVVLLGSMVMAAAMVVLLGVEYMLHVVIAVVLANVMSCVVSIGNLFVDVLRPQLDWKNETEVMKQNMNVMIGMLVSCVMIAAVAVPVCLLLASPAWMRMAVAVAILTLELASALLLLEKAAVPRLARLEP